MSESPSEVRANKIPFYETWMDGIALGLAGLCGIHCLLTPVLLIVLPILGTTIFVHEDFHFWMLMCVIPTTTIAVFMGCRRHKDKWVIACAVIGMALLTAAIWGHDHGHGHGEHDHTGHDHAAHVESDHHGVHNHSHHEHSAHAGHDHATHDHSKHAHEVHTQAKAPVAHYHAPLETILTTLGGVFLVLGHVRNYRLCRKDNCMHGVESSCAH